MRFPFFDYVIIIFDYVFIIIYYVYEVNSFDDIIYIINYLFTFCLINLLKSCMIDPEVSKGG